MSFENRKIYAIGVTVFLGILLTSCSFSSKTSKNYYEKSKDKEYDIVVVPGVPFENGQWSRIMKARIYWSKYLYDKGIARNIMYSGSAVYSPYSEAEIMALYANALGIPQENIYIENKAEHSTENIYYSFKKAKKLGFESVALASDPFQTKMLKGFTEKIVSSEIDLIPIVFDTIRAMESVMIDPEIEYHHLYVDEFIPLTERESFRERFRGTRGLSIDTLAYN